MSEELTDKQRAALKLVKNAPDFLGVGSFVKLRDRGLVVKVDAPSSGGRGMVYCQATAAGISALG